MRRVALVFPGQGAQHREMGKELAEAFPESRDVFAEADEALGERLTRICFEGSEQELALTENTQPAILAVSVAALAALRARGISATAAAGHSLGEYSAHVAAGTLAFGDALRAVRQRGRFMQEAVPVGQGAMAAILGLSADQVSGLCESAAAGEIVSPANLNSPQQTVIAGHTAAVDRVVEAARAAGARRALPLAVSAPFHCALMEPAARRLQPVLEQIEFGDPAIPVYANVDAAAIRDGATARQRLLQQVTATVRWQQVVESLADDGVDTMIEVGPGKVLAGLIKRIRKEIRTVSVGDPAGLAQAIEVLEDGS